MASVDFLATEITRRYGTVQRARTYFLYTRSGTRLTDMYQEGGRAILGWKGHSFTVFKNVMSRGLTGSFDTDWMPRIAKAVRALLGDERAVLVCESSSCALECARAFSNEAPVLWKAWSECAVASAPCVIVVPPFPWAESVHLVAIKRELYDKAHASVVPPRTQNTPNEQHTLNARIAPPLAAGITRALYDMIAALPLRTEKDWFRYDTVLKNYWTRTGPYLYPKIAESAYDDFVLHCLDCALVISPCYHVPSIVPFGVDKGVFTKLKNLPFVR